MRIRPDKTKKIIKYIYLKTLMMSGLFYANSYREIFLDY